MFGLLDIPTSGMIAQRTRMATIAANIANRHTILDGEGRVNPYRARQVMFAPGDPTAASPFERALGVHVSAIVESHAPPSLRWDPSNPYAYPDGPSKGYVPEPDINIAVEQVNALDASRAYEANVAAAEVTRAMITQAVRLLA